VIRRDIDHKLLTSVTEVLGLSFRAEDPREVFTRVLEHVLEHTGGECGFVAEVLHAAAGDLYLSSWTLSDISWHHETRASYRAVQERGEALESQPRYVLRLGPATRDDRRGQRRHRRPLGADRRG